MALILLDQGAYVNTSDSTGYTPQSPLMLVVRAELNERIQARFARFLCERGADVGQRDASGRTALDHAKTKVDCGELKTVLLRYSPQ